MKYALKDGLMDVGLGGAADDRQELSIAELLATGLYLQEKLMQHLTFMDEVMLALKGIDEFLDVSSLQRIQRIEVIRREIIYLTDFLVQFPHLFQILLKFSDVKGLYLLEILSYQRHLH